MRIKSFQCTFLVCWITWTKIVTAFGVGSVNKVSRTCHMKVSTAAKQRSALYIRATHDAASESSASSSSLLWKQTISKIWNDSRAVTTNSVVAGLTGYYFYKGLLSISNASGFWKLEGDIILRPLSIATWSGELIGCVKIVVQLFLLLLVLLTYGLVMFSS
jgi:hypothetical protein